MAHRTTVLIRAERHGKGASSPPSISIIAPVAVPGDQLCRIPRNSAGKRTVRARKSSLTAPSGHQRSAMQRHALPRQAGDMSPLTVRLCAFCRAALSLGGSESIQTDVRLIAATNRDLEKMVASEQFRSDLYYRLSIFTIKMPALRDRLDDLPLLIEHFMRRFNRELGKQVVRVAPESFEILRGHHWPGNLRELQSVLKQALLRATGPVLLPDFLPSLTEPEPAVLVGDNPDWDGFITRQLQNGSEDLYAELLALVERHLLTRVLTTRQQPMQAAKLLVLATCEQDPATHYHRKSVGATKSRLSSGRFDV